jgi:hypothetical protein
MSATHAMSQLICDWNGVSSSWRFSNMLRTSSTVVFCLKLKVNFPGSGGNQWQRLGMSHSIVSRGCLVPILPMAGMTSNWVAQCITSSVVRRRGTALLGTTNTIGRVRNPWGAVYSALRPHVRYWTFRCTLPLSWLSRQFSGEITVLLLQKHQRNLRFLLCSGTVSQSAGVFPVYIRSYKCSVRHSHNLGTVYKGNEISFISRVSTMLRRSLQQLYNGLEMFLTTMSWAH